MARPRTELHEILVGILGSRNVYFQPPASVSMKYPAIVYSWDGNNHTRADNLRYVPRRRYQVTVIDRDPDSEFPDMVEALPYCRMTTTIISENLHQFIFSISF